MYLKSIIFLLICTSFLASQEVQITQKIPYVEVIQAGKKIKIQRMNNPNAYLNNTYALTSRPSPPFFIQPFAVTEGVETFGELEVLDFVAKKKGIFIDARLPNWYQTSAIPGSINIPFKVFLSHSKERDKVLQTLGVVKDKHDAYDFKHAKKILLYCNGAWCGQSPTAIHALIKLGYPKENMKYYRGGMQAWQLLGLTTIVPKDTK